VVASDDEAIAPGHQESDGARRQRSALPHASSSIAFKNR
jgi:hypothetical protein